jgi:carboxyl-terminal processing protease
MRAHLLWVGFALGTGGALAAPGPQASPPCPDRRAQRAEARRFATQLVTVIDQVVEHYIRPVSKEELTHAALVGLYQAARKPVPRDLRARARQAAGLSTGLRARMVEALSSVSPGEEPLEKLVQKAREEVGRAEALEGQNALLVCCRAFTRLLDPHSGIVTAQEQQRAMALDLEAEGFGLELCDMAPGRPTVVEVVQLGSSAQRAGLRPGDVLTHLDGKPIAQAPPSLWLALRNRRVVAEVPPIQGPELGKAAPEPVRALLATYRRPGEAGSRQGVLLRERYRPETVLGTARRQDNRWRWWLDEKKKIAHVRLITLGRGSADELRGVLAGLKAQGMRGLLLDLRWCPGGYLNEAVEVADLFLGTCTVATVKSRNREDTVYRSTDVNKLRDFPLVVLVNGDTSGGAELIAAALQDHKRAVVAGQRTLGKASVQTPLHLGMEGVGLKLTSGTFLRPSGKNLHRFPESTPGDDWGVRPDPGAEFRMSVELGRRLRDCWQWQSLRPGSSRERLPLDDPRADPQREAARAVLEKMLEHKAQAWEKRRD